MGEKMPSYKDFLLLHEPQLISSGVPPHFWRTIHLRLFNFEHLSPFQIMIINYSDDNEQDEAVIETRPVAALTIADQNGLQIDDPEAIFLIDHSWTFRINNIRPTLENNAVLFQRLSNICGLDVAEEGCMAKVLKQLWKYCHGYTINTNNLTIEDRLPIWYIMDEMGCSVTHSDNPNFRMVPFFHVVTKFAYNLLFPIRECAQGDIVCCDFAGHIAKDNPQRPALLLPWVYTDLRNVEIVQIEPPESHFFSGNFVETYLMGYAPPPYVDHTKQMKVYSEYDIVNSYLTSPQFVMVDNEDDADILWLTNHFKTFAKLSRDTPNKFINQFPYEYLLTIKDLLCIIARRASTEHHDPDTLETYPTWLPTTYNLNTELDKFVSYFQQRKAKGLDNYWIIKPYNLARGLDMHITNNIFQIVRMPTTGSRIIQKYIERPVLFYRGDIESEVKFDMRYIILLKGIKPVEAYIYRKFFLRFANSAFILDHFEDYERHFTVMNYLENGNMHHVKCDDFLTLWREQYPRHDWSLLEGEICKMLYTVIDCATTKPAPSGMPQCVQSRALYAADIMLEWNNDASGMQPKLLEINFAPDCSRACFYYPQFFNDIFKLLFLNEVNGESFRLLTA